MRVYILGVVVTNRNEGVLIEEGFMQITITHNIDKVIQHLNDISRKQLPFAYAKALTMTAQDVQKTVLETLPSTFTLRTGWWKPSNKYGFKVKAATKTNLQSEVYTIAPWMILQEEGGTQTPRKKFLAIPTDQVKRTKRDLIRATQKPYALKRSFIVTTKTGQKLLLQRKSKNTIQTMYVFEKKAEIKPVLHFYRTGQIMALARFKVNFAQAFSEAIRTA